MRLYKAYSAYLKPSCCGFFPKDASQGYSKQEACVRGVRGVVYRNSAEFGPPSSELRKVIEEEEDYYTKCTYPNSTNIYIKCTYLG